jgi:hypothetical protein
MEKAMTLSVVSISVTNGSSVGSAHERSAEAEAMSGIDTGGWAVFRLGRQGSHNRNGPPFAFN